jgi:hypothetical protein
MARIKRLFMKLKICALWALLGILILPGSGHSQDMIKDISTLKQDHRFYLAGQSADQAIVENEVQQTLNEEYTRRYFSVWHQDKPRCTRDDVLWDFNKYGEKPGYGENRRKYDRSWMETLKRNAGLDCYPNRGIRGIVVANTDLRALPTSNPCFDGLDNESGYPFDRLQISALTANSPVYISHVSLDEAWVHVETSTYFGWAPARDIAFVEEPFARSWQNGSYAVLIRDRIPLYDDKGRLCFQGLLGAQFPLLREEGDFLDVWIGVTDENRQAVLKVSRIARENAAQRPLKMTRANLALVANELINQPYGWGGFHQNRDCSSLMMDLFAPFGIWLPRNSGQQAHEVGRFIDLENFSPEEKEAIILSYGIPYATLIWRKGHIMLYMGPYEGKALIFHNMWGVTTQDLRGRRGRKIVGRSVITTLRPGMEFCRGRAPGCDPLQSVLGMTLLLPNAPMPPEPVASSPLPNP